MIVHDGGSFDAGDGAVETFPEFDVVTDTEAHDLDEALVNLDHESTSWHMTYPFVVYILCFMGRVGQMEEARSGFEVSLVASVVELANGSMGRREVDLADALASVDTYGMGDFDLESPSSIESDVPEASG